MKNLQTPSPLLFLLAPVLLLLAFICFKPNTKIDNTLTNKTATPLFSMRSSLR